MPRRRTRRARLLWTILLASAVPGLLGGEERVRKQAGSAPDSAFVLRLVSTQQAVMNRLLEFCFHQRVLEEKLDGDGRVKEREEREELVCHLDGVPLYKQLAINGQPTGRRATEPWPAIRRDDNWRKQVERAAKRHQRDQGLIGEVPQVFDFTRVGEEVVDGRETILYRLTPKPDYQPRSRATELLKRITALSWIATESPHVVRFQAEVKQGFDIWGGLLLKVRPGATFEMRLKPFNGVWLPYYVEERWQARIGLFRNEGYHRRIERSDFRPAAQVLTAGRQGARPVEASLDQQR